MGNITIYHPNILRKVTIYSEFSHESIYIYMKNYGKSPFFTDKSTFLMDKSTLSTISMAIFNTFFYGYTRPGSLDKRRPRPRDLHLEPRDADRDAGRLDLRPLHAGDAGRHRRSVLRRTTGCPGGFPKG